MDNFFRDKGAAVTVLEGNGLGLASERVTNNTECLTRSRGHRRKIAGLRRLGNYRCLYANASSVQDKTGELECLVSEENKETIGISETWWDDDNRWDTVIPGYKLH